MDFLTSNLPFKDLFGIIWGISKVYEVLLILFVVGLIGIIKGKEAVFLSLVAYTALMTIGYHLNPT